MLGVRTPLFPRHRLADIPGLEPCIHSVTGFHGTIPCLVIDKRSENAHPFYSQSLLRKAGRPCIYSLKVIGLGRQTVSWLVSLVTASSTADTASRGTSPLPNNILQTLIFSTMLLHGSGRVLLVPPNAWAVQCWRAWRDTLKWYCKPAVP